MSLLLPPVTLPVATTVLSVPKLKPTRPPAPLPVASDNVTSPLAVDEVIDAVFSLRPARPPTKLLVPPETLPLAVENVIVPGLSPTRPPPLLPLDPVDELPTVTFTCAFDSVMVPRCPPGPRSPFWPTSPPAMTPCVAVPADTVLLVMVTLLIRPALLPARMPTNWPGPVTLGFAVTFALSKLTFCTTPVAPIAANRPTPMPTELGAVGAMIRLEIV